MPHDADLIQQLQWDLQSMFDTPDAAEEAFYEALENADLELMMAVWDRAEDVVCIHPAGKRLEGYQTVEHSWRSIFSKGATMQFEITDQRRIVTSRQAVHLIYENITMGSNVALVLSTNVYRLTADGWRMVLHHASPTPTSSTRKAADPGTLH